MPKAAGFDILELCGIFESESIFYGYYASKHPAYVGKT